jgi:hypothetical protein
MLRTLDKFEPAEANAILAAATLAQDGRPVPSEKVRRYSEEIEDLLSEVRSELKLSPTDNTINARRRISEALSQALSRAILGDTPVRDVQRVLGNRGTLPMGGYKISFRSEFKSLKENERFVEQAIRSADRIEHLAAAHSEGAGERGVTLAAKRVVPKKGSAHWLLIDSTRQGSSLFVNAAWRVFEQTVELENVDTPTDLLRRFLEVYGLEVEVRGRAKGRLLQNVQVPVAAGAMSEGSYFKVHDEEVEDSFGVFSGSSVELEADDVVLTHDNVLILGYAIDLRPYRADRRKFG